MRGDLSMEPALGLFKDKKFHKLSVTSSSRPWDVGSMTLSKSKGLRTTEIRVVILSPGTRSGDSGNSDITPGVHS